MLSPGDHLKFKGAFGYPSLYHHGVYVGNGTVVHFYAQNAKDKNNAEIQAISLQRFIDLASPHPVEKVVTLRPRLPVAVIQQRCLSKLGQKDYHVLLNNCEHFANWATTGEHRSYQVETTLGRKSHS